VSTQSNFEKSFVITDPPFMRALLGSTRWAWFWLPFRLYIGYTWLTSGLGKFSNPAWMQTGEALKGFWENAVRVPDAPARPPIAFEWYRQFIQSMLDSQSYTWFGKLVPIGETVVGVLLLLGAFTGIAAFLGAFMNWNFMMAGTASINPLMFAITIFIILAWKNSGWIGLDRWLLPIIGTPWRREKVVAPPGELPSAPES